MTTTVWPKLVELQTSKRQADERLIKALETVLERARSGQIHALVVVGVDEVTGDTHRFSHHGLNASLIGALATMLTKLTNEYNAHEN